MAKTMRIEIASNSSKNDNWIAAWLDLPAQKHEIEDAFQRARIVDDETLREYYIYDCERLPIAQGKRLDSPTMDELNFFANRLDSLTEEEQLALLAVSRKHIDQNEDALISAKDLINLTYGLDKVMILSNVKNTEELGKFAIDNELSPVATEVPKEMHQYLNYDEIGKLQQDADGGEFVKGHYVVAGSYALQEIYDGKNLPIKEITEDKFAFKLQVAKPPESEEMVEIAEQKAKWITLPIDKSVANEIANEQGVGSIEECVYFGFESTIPQIERFNFGDMHDFDKLNHLSEMLLEMTPTDQVKFKAVLSAEEPTKIEEILDVARNLNQYEFAPQIEDAEHFFKSYLERHMDSRIDSRWIAYLSAREEGYEMLGKLGAKITDYGIVSARCGTLYEPIMRGESQILDDEFELIEVNGQAALFTNGRINANDVPKGLFKYDLREGEINPFVTIESHVLVNHAGTILVKQPFDFAGKDHIPLTDETSPNFLGEPITAQEFMNRDYEQDEQITIKMGGA